MYCATAIPHQLHFRQAAGTSRGVLHTKTSWFIRLEQSDQPGHTGWGECSILPGLSPDDRPNFTAFLTKTVLPNVNHYLYHPEQLNDWPAIRFALEMAWLDLQNGGQKLLFPSDFTHRKKRIPINGLIWMGSMASMEQQIQKKITEKTHCIKIKIGAIDFHQELQLLDTIRSQCGPEQLEIRLDANGAFQAEEALDKIDQLAKYHIHSIEQPIKAGQSQALQRVCKASPIPIALDEELIGLQANTRNAERFNQIQAAYFIIKPSLLGGFKCAQSWIDMAKTNQIGYWVTSALESNIGLNAIAQWTATHNNPLPQGLGTGTLFRNNIPSPLVAEPGFLHYDSDQKWDLSVIT